MHVIERSIHLLGLRDIASLISAKISAIHIKEAFNINTARQISDYVDRSEIRDYRYSDYLGNLKTSGVQCYGVAFNELYGALKENNKPYQRFENYARDCAYVREELRSVCRPYGMPIDGLRCVLADIWPWGANVLRLEEIKANVGIVRVMRPTGKPGGSTEYLPRVDRLPVFVREMESQLSAICYLDVPESGGELEVWSVTGDVFEKEPAEFRNTCGGGSTQIIPNIGDIILINTGVPHAVKSFPVGRQISQSMFIGYRPEEPLLLWS